MEYFADPLRPDCTGFGTADGVDCQDGATTACSSGALLSIQTVDRSVRLVKHYDLPVPPSMDELEGKADLADMFSLDQQPAVVFTNKIVVRDCRDAEHSTKLVCAQRLLDYEGRRRVQGRSCTHADFIRRDSELMTACQISGCVFLFSVVCCTVSSLMAAQRNNSLAAPCEGTTPPS